MTKNIVTQVDRLWISSLKGFDPNDLEFYDDPEVHEGTPYNKKNLLNRGRRYLIHSDEKWLTLEPAFLGGWDKKEQYSRTHDGFETKRYLAFKDACFGKDEPTDPMDLSFAEAREMYGDCGILSIYDGIKSSFDLGKKAIENWPGVLKPELI